MTLLLLIKSGVNIFKKNPPPPRKRAKYFLVWTRTKEGGKVEVELN